VTLASSAVPPAPAIDAKGSAAPAATPDGAKPQERGLFEHINLRRRFSFFSGL